MSRLRVLLSALILLATQNAFALYMPWVIPPSSETEIETRAWDILKRYPDSKDEMPLAFVFFRGVIVSDKNPNSAYCGAGQAALYREPPEYPKAIENLQKCRDLYPNLLEPRADLVRLFQITNNTSRLQGERQAMFSLWKKLPPESRPETYWMDLWKWESQGSQFVVMIEEYFVSTGTLPAIYVFRVYQNKGDTMTDYKIRLERAVNLNTHIERLKVANPTKVYASNVHSLDYYPGDSADEIRHCTLQFYEGRPSYDVVAAEVRDLIAVGPERDAISCVTRDQRVYMLRPEKMEALFNPR